MKMRLRTILRNWRNVVFRWFIRAMWKDWAFRFFIVEAVVSSQQYDLRFSFQQMAKMTEEEKLFFRFLVGHSSESYSQDIQDLWALYECGESHGGFFVEFGATDGLRINNTVLLEKNYGWTGILAEPNPAWHKELATNRSARIDWRCVDQTSNVTREFLSTPDPEYGGLVTENSRNTAKKLGMTAEKILVQTVSLNDLLEQHAAPTRIDFMSVDTEGSEFEILSALDPTKWDVRLFTIEMGPPEKDQAIDRLMKQRGYIRRFERFSSLDAWYKRLPE
jgi:FkbM family methyltransferase